MFPKLSCNTAIAAVSMPLTRLSRFRFLRNALILAPLLLLFGDVHLARPAQAGETDAASSEFFRQKIAPILATRCLACHSDAMKSSGLSLESAEGLKKGASMVPWLFLDLRRRAACIEGSPTWKNLTCPWVLIPYPLPK